MKIYVKTIHVSTNCNMTFGLNFCLDLPARRGFRLCTDRVNQKEDINDGLYGTNQTFIVELGFLGVYSDEDLQR